MSDLPLVGEEFADYRLGPRLGRGGMSVVFQAENWRLGNVIALKILAPDLANDDIFRTRFLQESRIAAGLNHPHVIPIIDSGAYDGLLYIAMRYVAGTDLRQMIAEQHRLDPGTAVHLLSQAARALDAAHRRGLVHRDVKPANLLVERTSDDADPDHLYLADFGITKYVGGPGIRGLTAAGTIMGTALYLAPEQAQELAVGGAADQYSLGCVLYECLTGRAPFEMGSGPATMIAHVEEPPPPATMFRPDLPPAVDAVFARVLAKHPGERYPTCRAFMAAASDALVMPGGLPVVMPAGMPGGLPVGRPGRGRSADFQPAPLPLAFSDAARDPVDRQYLATQDLPGAEPLPGTWQAPVEEWDRQARAGDPRGADEWSFYSADGDGESRQASPQAASAQVPAVPDATDRDRPCGPRRGWHRRLDARGAAVQGQGAGHLPLNAGGGVPAGQRTVLGARAGGGIRAKRRPQVVGLPAAKQDGRGVQVPVRRHHDGVVRDLSQPGRAVLALREHRREAQQATSPSPTSRTRAHAARRHPSRPTRAPGITRTESPRPTPPPRWRRGRCPRTARWAGCSASR